MLKTFHCFVTGAVASIVCKFFILSAEVLLSTDVVSTLEVVRRYPCPKRESINPNKIGLRKTDHLCPAIFFQNLAEHSCIVVGNAVNLELLLCINELCAKWRMFERLDNSRLALIWSCSDLALETKPDRP